MGAALRPQVDRLTANLFVLLANWFCALTSAHRFFQNVVVISNINVVHREAMLIFVSGLPLLKITYLTGRLL